MRHRDRSHVWYAAFGSNLCRSRFDCYVRGGRPVGAERIYAGCRDKTPPSASQALSLSLELYFARRSWVWDGHGVAFVAPADTGLGHGPVRCRAWLLTLDQFADVARQENHQPELPVPDLERILDHGEQLLGTGWYARVLLCQRELRGWPVLTLTSPPGETAPPRAPAPAYVATMARGLIDAHEMSPLDAARYLAAMPGLADRVSLDEVVAWCHGEVAAPAP